MPAILTTDQGAAVSIRRREPVRTRLTPSSREPIEIGLINNMPDAALEGAERQFAGLMSAAGGGAPLRITCYSLPGVPRAERGLRYINGHYASGRYAPIEDLWNRRLDGLVITGAEPQTAKLQDEPFWPDFRRVLEWAEDNAVSTVSSCLAAHAAVLHLDGVERRALPDKRLGLFDHDVVEDHPLVVGLPPRLKIPHSRWNEVDAATLRACGYLVLTCSPEAGVDLFIKERKALFLFFQGHPEYDSGVLLKEYKRDVGRYLRSERPDYPNIPKGYFDADSVERLAGFRARAAVRRDEGLLAEFPLASEVQAADRSLGTPAAIIYRNWLSHLVARKEQEILARL
ncbi:homoserine O-succinyltransferase MetA [Methylocapsa acidiphila]|uniref:homoserine O-succinyltransferase MetA n=1 Tax=Methylocapsa acidiphila TaxID=133552 RepID=UPI00055D7E3F|nr:homoserine O-succinyltransferase [Methylocapsa acidiphila]